MRLARKARVNRRMTLLPIFLAVHAAEDDTCLVTRMQRRDPNALAELYDRYGRVTFSLIVRVVRDAGIAEDLVQETFLRVWNRVHGFDAQKGSIGPWLLAVARNRAIDYLRSVAGRERNALEFEETDHPALYCEMEKDILNSDQARRVKSAVEKLSPNQRLHISLGQEFLQTCTKQVGAELVEQGVLRHQLLIRFNNVDHLHLRIGECSREESPHVVVNEADDGQAHRRFGGIRQSRQRG